MPTDALPTNPTVITDYVPGEDHPLEAYYRQRVRITRRRASWTGRLTYIRSTRQPSGRWHHAAELTTAGGYREYLGLWSDEPTDLTVTAL